MCPDAAYMLHGRRLIITISTNLLAQCIISEARDVDTGDLLVLDDEAQPPFTADDVAAIREMVEPEFWAWMLGCPNGKHIATPQPTEDICQSK